MWAMPDFLADLRVADEAHVKGDEAFQVRFRVRLTRMMPEDWNR
jgi:hypothetical protein